MTPRADVYAGDLALSTERRAELADYRFRVIADATPDVLLRVAVVLNAANTPPRKATLQPGREGEVEIDVLIPRISGGLAESISRKLDQLMMVTRVHVERAG